MVLPTARISAILTTLISLWLTGTAIAGNERASLSVVPLITRKNHTHRQDLCERFDQVQAGELELRDGLAGLALQPVVALGDFFNYSRATGIDPDYPGLLADLMDALAKSAGFAWRDSFAIMERPEVLGKTWMEMLLWGTEHFDVFVGWADHSVDRLESGISFIDPAWFDGSIVLIRKKNYQKPKKEIHLNNFLMPFEPLVWLLMMVTVVVSALVYQLIEYLHDEREERSMVQWFSDNLYLSCLSFTQNFEYAPNSPAGRIFAISMGIWALVMGATYTANLASLFVETNQRAPQIESIDQAVASKLPVCVYGNTNVERIVRNRYRDVKIKPAFSVEESYSDLRLGDCEILATQKDSWLGFQDNSAHNPDCELEWVGREVQTIKSGFALKADAGHLCTNFIREVLNLHMTEVMENGALKAAWTKHRSKTKNQNCEAPDLVEDSSSRRRQLLSSGEGKQQPRKSNHHDRILKGAATKSGAVGGATEGEEFVGTSALTLEQMLGTFLLHWALMAVAMVCCLAQVAYQKHYPLEQKEKVVEQASQSSGMVLGMDDSSQSHIRAYDGHAQRRRSIAAYDPRKSSTLSAVESGHLLVEPETQPPVRNRRSRSSICASKPPINALQQFQLQRKYGHTPGWCRQHGSPPDEDSRDFISNHYGTPEWHRTVANLQESQQELMQTVKGLIEELKREKGEQVDSPIPEEGKFQDYVT